MVEASLIIAFSLALFVYWFRYTVLLLLREDQEDVQQVAAGHLCLLETHRALHDTRDEARLDRLHSALEKDYRMLRYLLDHAAGLGQRPAEHFLLMADYRLAHLWYYLTRSASTRQAHRALEEMAGVLNHISYRMGERAATLSRA